MPGDHEALREVLEAIDDLLTNEIRVRWGMDNSMTEEEAAKGSRLYSLLLVPRNIARNGLAKAALSTPTPPQPANGEVAQALEDLIDATVMTGHAIETCTVRPTKAHMRQWVAALAPAATRARAALAKLEPSDGR